MCTTGRGESSSKREKTLFFILFTRSFMLTDFFFCWNFPSREILCARLRGCSSMQWVALIRYSVFICHFFSFILIFILFSIFYLIRFIERVKSEEFQEIGFLFTIQISLFYVENLVRYYASREWYTLKSELKSKRLPLWWTGYHLEYIGSDEWHFQ